MLADSGKGSSSITDAQFNMLVRRVDKLEEGFAQLKKSQTLQSSAGFRETSDTIGIDDALYKDLSGRIN